MLKLRAKVSIAETGDGTVLLDERAGRYWQLNSSAARVLRTVLDGGEVEAAVIALTQRYRVSVEEATRDVNHLVGQLRAAELLIASAAGEPGSGERR